MNAHEFEYINIISLVIAAKKNEMKVETTVSCSLTRSYVQDRFWTAHSSLQFSSRQI